MSAGVDGQEKVIAAAQHIVKSLATSKNAADDMIRILSGFDHRLSSLNPNPSSSGEASSSSDSYKEDLEKLEKAEKVIMQWDSSDSLLFESSSDVISLYFAAVDDLISISQSFSSSEGRPNLATRASNILQLSMVRLEEELHPLLIRNTVPLDASGLSCSIRRLSLSFPSSEADFDTSSEFEGGESATPTSSMAGPTPRHPLLDDERFDLVKPEAVADLRDLADRMIRAGYGKELSQVYCSIRKDVLDEYLSIIGIERLSIDEVQRMEWRHLDEKTKKWIQGVKIVIRGLLSGERRLSETIFSSNDEIQEECFLEITKGCVLQLLNFGDAVAIIPRSAEKLFRILDMYEVVNNEIMPELRVLFGNVSGEGIYLEAECILGRLGDAIKGTLYDFGMLVLRENTKRPIQGGEIHPLTRYVMNYMRLLVVYGETLEGLLGEEGDLNVENIGNNNDDENQNLGTMTPYGRKLYTLISYLETNLEEKAKLYEDGGLQCIFLMNNVLYIYNKSKDSELGRILGDNWLRRRRGKIRQYSKTYLRVSWTKTLSFLRDDGLSNSGSSGHSSRMALKEKFKNFNLAFEELYRVQTTWKVPDPQLREEIKISISEHVIPAYRAFLGRYGGQIDSGRHATRYIKYSTEDLESCLSDLFEGVPGVANLPKRRV